MSVCCEPDQVPGSQTQTPTLHPTIPMNKTLLLPFLAAAAAVSPVPAVIVDFNTAATDLTDNFTRSTATSSNFTWSSSVGVGSGGGVSVSTDAGGANYNYNTAYDLGAGGASNTWTLSTFFRTNAVTGTSNNQVAGLGLMGTVTDEISAAGRFVGVTLRQGTAASGNLSLALTNNFNGTQTNALQGTDFVPVTNNWYRLTLSVTKTGTLDQFSLSASVEDWGAAGTSFGSTVRSFTNQTLTNNSVYSDTTVYGGFFARQTAGNPIQIQAVDNFSIVPEPSGLLLFGLAGVAMFRRRRA